MNPRARACLLALPVLISSCGVLGIEVRRQSLSSFTLGTDLTDGSLFTEASSRVAYLPESQFNQQVSFLKVRVQADLKYSSLPALGAVKLNFFVRAQPPTDCQRIEKYYVCDSEQADRKIGGVTLEPGQTRTVTLEGGALDDAVNRGQGYVGLQLEEGRLYATDTLEFLNVVAIATL